MSLRPIRHSFAAIGLLLLALSPFAQAQSTPDFPALTGRVVDQASLLSPSAEQRLTQMLSAYEKSAGDQIVVVTLPDLQGYTIENYGYQLGRHWGIGQKGQDNGALLIVAKKERKVRIEVGYGLEGKLTDAASATIINQIITPAFRQGQFETGILNGAAAMIKVLGGDKLAQTDSADGHEATSNKPRSLIAVVLLIMILLSIFRGGGRGRGRGRSALLGGMILGSGLGGRGGGFGGGGGFSGGGGGFGGGGASGGW